MLVHFFQSRWLPRAAAALLLMVAVGRGAAADDWLDDMPSVPAIVEVVRDSVDQQIRQSPQIAADPDYFPLRLMATFVLMRWAIEFQIETQGDLPPERLLRAQNITKEYMQAEYAISLGTARRNGRVAKECQKDGPNRADFRTFPSAEACHRHVTQRFISNIYPSFAWRNEIFPLLFCDRATFYLALMQENILTLPAPIRSPAVIGEMPDASPLLGAQVCVPYGGDAGGNGLCEDWEKPRDKLATGGAAACAAIIMEKVRLASHNGLVVTLAKNSGKLGASASFRISLSVGPSMDASAQPVWEGEAKIQAGPTPDAALQAVLAPEVAFRPDPANPDLGKPWLIVELTSAKSAPPVRCGLPLPIAELSKLPTHQGVGLFGPYPDIGKSIYWAGFKALALTSKPGESGFVVLRREAATKPYVFYATAPVPATEASVAGKQPLFHPEDYRASMVGAFKDSCEVLESFTLSGTVHTHPSEWVEFPSNSNFSMLDFNQAIAMSQTTHSVFKDLRIAHSATRAIFLIPMGTLKILMFVADPASDSAFKPEEMACAVQKFFPEVCVSWKTLFSDKYDRYTDPKRQVKIGSYPESIKD